jgi:hypothetical protein
MMYVVEYGIVDQKLVLIDMKRLSSNHPSCTRTYCKHICGGVETVVCIFGCGSVICEGLSEGERCG